ncbi:uncharacterized protein ASPGLDRAFT_51090, partial [Aspergillus glaucus CBS 516.65]
MPPNRSRSNRNSQEQEGRILLAIDAFKKEKSAQSVKQHVDLIYHVPPFLIALMVINFALKNA